MGRMTLGFNQADGVAEFHAPFMSHETSQQTVVQPRGMFAATEGVQYLSTFDPNDDEMTDALAHELEQTHPFHVLTLSSKSV